MRVSLSRLVSIHAGVLNWQSSKSFHFKASIKAFESMKYYLKMLTIVEDFHAIRKVLLLKSIFLNDKNCKRLNKAWWAIIGIPRHINDGLCSLSLQVEFEFMHCCKLVQLLDPLRKILLCVQIFTQETLCALSLALNTLASTKHAVSESKANSVSKRS